MNPLRILTSIAGIAILALLASAGVVSAQNPDSPAITQLLEKVRADSARANNDAHLLESYTRSRMSSQSHGAQLETIRGHVNNLIDDSNEMAKLRNEGSPWQQQAIDRINSILPEISAHLTTTIEHFRDNGNRTHMKEYRDLVETNRKMIEHANAIISDYVKYGKSKARSEALQQHLKAPASEPTS